MEMSPGAYFMKHRQSAALNWEQMQDDNLAAALIGQSPLMVLIRDIFDFLSGVPGANTVPARVYMDKLPDLARKYPQLALHFRKMDVDANGNLEYDEFVNFCLSAETNEATRRLNIVTVTGEEREVSHVEPDAVTKTFKNPSDPMRQCEIGVPPPLLPWESHHKVDWKIEELDADRKLLQVKYHGLEIPPGKFIASPPFEAGGVKGYLRFWPNGYFNNSQKRERGEMDLGGLRAHAWCALGLFCPRGTHLKFRFFVGDQLSNVRECYWMDGTMVNQLWTPDALEPPKLDSFSVGVEIIKNFRQLHVAESVQRTCTAGGKPGSRGRRLSEKEKGLGVPLLRSVEPRLEETFPSPRLMKPWQLPVLPPRFRGKLGTMKDASRTF